MPSKILVINLVGLTRQVLSQMPGLASRYQQAGSLATLTPPLPAVTCTSQATITTGTLPRDHGIVSNGWYFQESGEVRFWMRSDRLVQGQKIWQAAKQARPGLTVANLFWRYCTHSECDITVTERPTYWANGRKSPDIYTSPGDLRNDLVESLGEFPLFRFWGPATSIESSQWIADATLQVMQKNDPDLTLTYLPHIDYDLQKFGPTSGEATQAIQQVDQVSCRLIDAARECGRQVVVLSEYGMTDVNRPVFLNRHLREAGLLAIQHAKNGELLEPAASRAFAACSHQVAHVYVNSAEDVLATKKLLSGIEGVDRVLAEDEIKAAGLDHHRTGQLVAVAERNCWFAYPYWLDDSAAPDFASCVAIHEKPGHDPAEMFLGPGGKARAMRRLLQTKMGLRVPFDVISQDPGKIRGSHGRLPDDPDDAPIMLTDWSIGPVNRAESSSMEMTEVKSVGLQRLVG